jgi:DNA-binding NarL/FixJ family response regulator
MRRVVAGECVVDPAVVDRLLARRRRDGPLDVLTVREREVLAHTAEGLTNAAIGARLRIAERTVEVLINQVFGKLGLGVEPGVNRRVMAVLTYLRSTTDTFALAGHPSFAEHPRSSVTRCRSPRFVACVTLTGGLGRLVC